MAVGKVAMPNISAVAAATRKALDATVAELTETIASLPATAIKRRLRGATIVMPNGLKPAEIECKDEKPQADTSAVKEFL